MQKLTEHYQQLLGFPAIWEVDDVNLSVSGLKIEVHLRFVGDEVICPQCGVRGKAYDKAPEQRWRHLDTMQFETIIIARIPRCQCETCGVKTIAVPWAAPHSRFTLMFEGFAVALLQHCSSVQAASNILKLDWHAVDQIMKRAVERGLLRREPDDVVHVGMDEKSFRSGQKYITILNDLDKSRVLDVIEDRTLTATKKLLGTLSKQQRKAVKSVSLDMWQAFATATHKLLPAADIVHDRFHISKYLNDAVNKVRHQESQELKKDGDTRLVGSKYTWLRNPEKMTKSQKTRFNELIACEFKTGVAWVLKNIFRDFWNCSSGLRGEIFFAYWCELVDKTKLKPLIKVKDMMERHKGNILNYCAL
ncbi:transposase IS204/IS1001/IS1096/IS1165 family protein [Pelodictyon phaeoclathratiforme BU-1]|jgi:transposase|uniref:Transposase IS204/IS1001/IS1096/IS1165 family protein n=1 Tax=Pelodictyon phaeoclathratiforme (strain DSM 5477 / BU-1) TaxID=324925 RepID=B4SGV2_PELPB|nr:ISL3 family transposase [Pelodictyon phaeoclathratiforme]ACF43515.1 transposase IS204/IS1001/IS1096/IS1165 family protein [Pelodictyon phaeoclathratiforme BU-1]